MTRRQRRLAGHARDAGYDSLIITEPENLFYATGFWGEAAAIMEQDGTTIIVAPELEAARAEAESDECDVVVSGRGDALFSGIASKIRGKKPCTDCQNHTTMMQLKKALPKISHNAAPIAAARITKDSGEIEVLKKASRIIDGMFRLCTTTIKAGMRESDLQGILMSHAIQRGMFDTGYRSTLNPLIVAGGPNGALPHAQVSKRKFRRGDLIVVDITLRYEGYVSDATRTFGIGRIPSEMRDIYEIVRESQSLGLAAAKPGASCGSVDAACRNYIAANGYEKFFIHSTGHGIGLEVHEQPAVSRNVKTRLKKNMAITVEPGIYIPGKFGIRIEDSLIIGNPATIMHKFTRRLQEL